MRKLTPKAHHFNLRCLYSRVLQEAHQFKFIASAVVSILVACDAQLNDAGSLFMADVPGVSLFFLTMVGLLRLRSTNSLFFALGVGALASLAVLIKFDFLYVFPLILLVSMVSAPKPSRTTYFHKIMIVAMVYLLVMGGYMVRNHALTGAWFVTSKDSINLYIGNNKDAPTRGFRYGMTDDDWRVVSRIPRESADELHTYGPEIAMRSFFRSRVLELFVKSPARIFTMFKQKFWIFLNSGEYLHYPLLGNFSHILSLFIMVFAAVCSVFYLWITKRDMWRGAIVPAGYLAILTMVSLVFFEPRYMTHLFPLAIIISTVSIFNVFDKYFDSSRAKVA